jgi:DNA-binding transcriptional MerR regulator/predicted transcriptional regulator YdeE
MLSIGDFAQLGQVSRRMLRHYDQLGLLRPDAVDRATGYRLYSVAQLAQLHRLLALRDLGFTLEQLADLLSTDVSVEQLRGMLRMRQAQIEQTITEERARLARVEARLRRLERSGSVPTHDVVVKQSEPMRLVEATASAPGFGDGLDGVFGPLYDTVTRFLQSKGVRPGTCVAWYEQTDDEDPVVVHAGFQVAQSLAGDDKVQVVDLPVVQVASVVHRGSMSNVHDSYDELVRWIDDNGFRIAGRSRELYLEWHEDAARNVTELQMPVAKRS